MLPGHFDINKIDVNSSYLVLAQKGIQGTFQESRLRRTFIDPFARQTVNGISTTMLMEAFGAAQWCLAQSRAVVYEITERCS